MGREGWGREGRVLWPVLRVLGRCGVVFARRLVYKWSVTAGTGGCCNFSRELNVCRVGGLWAVEVRSLR